jgi:hypothetical protein
MIISIDKLNIKFLEWCNNTGKDSQDENALKEYFNFIMQRGKFTKVFKEKNNFKFQ